MKKSDLRTGMRVVLREKKAYIVLLNIEDHGDVVVADGSWGNLKNYNENLTHRNYNDLDIIAVYSREHMTNIIDLSIKGVLLWSEEEKITFTYKGVNYSKSTLESIIDKSLK